MSWFSRLIHAVNPRRLDHDLAEELQDHLERRASELSQKGMNAEEATRQAQVRFGNVTRLCEQSRDFRLWTTLEGTFQDIRYAWRGMRKGPAFTATAVLSLGLAIGANTAIYSIVDAAVLRPLPVAQPKELFALSSPGISDIGSVVVQGRDSFSYPMYMQFVAASKPAARLGLFGFAKESELQDPNHDGPIGKITKEFVSGNAFDLLGIPPALGRLFSADEDRWPGRAVAVLSYAYWQKRFRASPFIVGQAIKIDGVTCQIAGIARKGFFGVEPGKIVDVWVPAATYADRKAFTEPFYNWFRIIGRFKPGATPERLQALLQPSFHAFQVERVKRFPMMPVPIQKQFLESAIQVHSAATGVSNFRKAFSRPLWIVFGVGAGILFIACANVASLLLARSTARVTEMAMRVSLGAGRMRLIRQMLTESLILSLMAGGLGWLLARALAPLLVTLLSKESDPVQFALAIDTRVLLFCIGVSTFSAALFGLVPALHASGGHPILALRNSGGQAGKLRLGKLFVTIQVACSFCLVLVGAAFLFSLGNLLHVNPGFDARKVAVFKITTDAQSQTKEAQLASMFQLQRRIADQPGIEGAALAPWPIFEGGGWSEQVIIPGKGPSQREEVFYQVSPGYFTTLRTPLLAGRDFQARDSFAREPMPVIINEAFAQKYFNGLDVLGREFSYSRDQSFLRQVVIGLVSDSHYFDLRTGVDPMVYLPVEGNSWFTLYVRSPLKAGTLMRLLDREMRAIGADARIQETTTLDTIVGNTLLREKLLADIGGAFAFFGLLLASIGLFGLLSYSVSRRTKDLGIRAALGAQRIQIVGLVLRDVVGLVSGGLIMGLAGALPILEVFGSLLFGVRNADPRVIASAAALFLVTGFAAVSLPAHRAATIDPTRALREE